MIPLIKPDLSYADVAGDIEEVIKSGQLTRGRNVQEFERLIADYVGTKYAFTTTSGTTALHLSLVAAGVGEGDEVLVSDFTFPASGNVIVQCGATPILVDCRPGYFDMDMNDAENKITESTRAILAVDPFGQPCNAIDLRKLSDEHGLFLLEDAACALGARSDTHICGAWSDAGCFSFHPRKVITCGEGGAITTDDDRLAEKIEILRNHGGLANEGVSLDFVDAGFNYRLSEVQAVLGIAQIRRIEDIIGRRREIAKQYLSKLQDIDFCKIPLTTEVHGCTFQSFVILLNDNIDRDVVILGMKEAGVETTIGTYAMHAQPFFAKYGYDPGDLPNSWRAQQQSLTLPLSYDLTFSDIDSIINCLFNQIESLNK